MCIACLAHVVFVRSFFFVFFSCSLVIMHVVEHSGNRCRLADIHLEIGDILLSVCARRHVETKSNFSFAAFWFFYCPLRAPQRKKNTNSSTRTPKVCASVCTGYIFFGGTDRTERQTVISGCGACHGHVATFNTHLYYLMRFVLSIVASIHHGQHARGSSKARKVQKVQNFIIF